VGYVKFKAVGGAIKSRVRGRHLGGKTKTEPPGSVLANDMWGASVFGRGDLVGVGYVGFEAVEGCDQVAREGEAFGGEIENRAARARLWRTICGGASVSGREDLVGVGYVGFGAVGGGAVGSCARRGGIWEETRNRAAGARFWPTKSGGLLFQVEGSWLGLGKCS